MNEKHYAMRGEIGRFYESEKYCESCGKEIIPIVTTLVGDIKQRSLGYVLAIERATKFVCPYSSWEFHTACSVECASELLQSHLAGEHIIYAQIDKRIRTTKE